MKPIVRHEKKKSPLATDLYVSVVWTVGVVAEHYMQTCKGKDCPAEHTKIHVGYS